MSRHTRAPDVGPGRTTLDRCERRGAASVRRYSRYLPVVTRVISGMAKDAGRRHRALHVVILVRDRAPLPVTCGSRACPGSLAAATAMRRGDRSAPAVPRGISADSRQASIGMHHGNRMPAAASSASKGPPSGQGQSARPGDGEHL